MNKARRCIDMEVYALALSIYSLFTISSMISIYVFVMQRDLMMTVISVFCATVSLAALIQVLTGGACNA